MDKEWNVLIATSVILICSLLRDHCNEINHKKITEMKEDIYMYL